MISEYKFGVWGSYKSVFNFEGQWGLSIHQVKCKF